MQNLVCFNPDFINPADTSLATTQAMKFTFNSGGEVSEDDEDSYGSDFSVDQKKRRKLRKDKRKQAQKIKDFNKEPEEPKLELKDQVKMQ